MVATSTTPGGSVVGPATSQLQARLSQPPAAPGNREQLRYLLQRGPGNQAVPVASEAAIPNTSAMTSVVAASASSASAAAPGVTTTKVWVPGEVLENVEMHTMLKVHFLSKNSTFGPKIDFWYCV